MQVLYFATLRQVTGKSQEQWDRPEATLGDLMRDLTACYGRQLGQWLLTDGKLSQMAIIMVNGRDVRHLQGLDTPLASDDTVVIFPPVAGG